MSKHESFSKSDKLVTGLAVGGMLAAGGVIAYKQGQDSELDKRPACIEIPVKDGDGPAVMLKRFDSAGLNPTGKTYVFRVDNSGDLNVLQSNDGFPTHKGSTELERNDVVAVEHADPIACVDPEVGGIVSETVEVYDRD